MLRRNVSDIVAVAVAVVLLLAVVVVVVVVVVVGVSLFEVAVFSVTTGKR